VDRNGQKWTFKLLTSNNMTIRDANNLDIPFINEIMRVSKAHWGYGTAFMDVFMEKFSINEKYLAENTTKVLSQNEHIIGFFSFAFHDDQSLELYHFFLHPDFIGKGFGRDMWNACCLVAQELGANEFTLWSDPQAELFYSKMGCEKIGVKKSPLMENRYPSIMRYKLQNN